MDALGTLTTTPTLAPSVSPVLSGRSNTAEQAATSANPQASFTADGVRSVRPSDAAGDHRKLVDPAAPSSSNQPLKDPRRAEQARSGELSQALEQAQQKEIQALSVRDREVREHERMHARVGGAHAAAPEYELTRGPDGRYYATGGKVRIDTSPIANDPQATLEKAEIIKRAALSVPEPSSEDRAVAALADQMMAEAKIELAELAKVGQVAAKAETGFVGDNEASVVPVGLAGEEATGEQSNAARPESDEQALQTLKVGLSGEHDLSPDERFDRAAQEKAEKEEARERAEAVAERVRENSEAMEEKRQAALAELQRYNAELSQLQEHLKEVNNRLLDAGVFEKLLPKGSLLDLTV